MTSKNLLILTGSFGLWLMAAAWSLAAVQLESLTVGYASFSGHYVPMWIAVEDGLGKKYGLDLKAVYAGRMRPQQLLVSGDVPIVIATGSGALTSHILGAKDQVIVASFINKSRGRDLCQERNQKRRRWNAASSTLPRSTWLPRNWASANW